VVQKVFGLFLTNTIIQKIIAQGAHPVNERNYPPNVVEQAKALAEALKAIDKAFKVGELTNAALEADLEKAAAAKNLLSKLEIQITDQRNQRDAAYGELWKKVKRMRAGVKAIYGDDSSQYEMAGGTRLSERKPRTRKKAESAE
jgi:hypothetical protein